MYNIDVNNDTKIIQFKILVFYHFHGPRNILKHISKNDNFVRL